MLCCPKQEKATLESIDSRQTYTQDHCRISHLAPQLSETLWTEGRGRGTFRRPAVLFDGAGCSHLSNGWNAGLVGHRGDFNGRAVLVRAERLYRYDQTQLEEKKLEGADSESRRISF